MSGLLSSTYLSHRIQQCAIETRRKQQREHRNVLVYFTNLFLNCLLTLLLTIPSVVLCSLLLNFSLDMVEYISVLWWVDKVADTLSITMNSSYIEPFLWALAQVLVEHVFAYSILYLVRRRRTFLFSSLLPLISLMAVQCLFVLGFETSRGYLAFQDKAISRAIFWVTMLTLTLELRNVPRKYCILFSRTISLYLVSLVVGSVVFIFPWIALLHALLIQLWTGSNELGGTLNELFDYQVHVLFTCIPWFLLFAYAFTIDFHFDTKYFWKLWKQLERKHENGTHAVILLLLFYLLKQLCISFVSIGSHSTNSKTLDSHQEQLTTPMEVGQISEQNNSNRKEEQIVTPVLEAVSPRTKASIEEWTANCSEEERFKVFEYMFNSKRDEFQRCGVAPPKIDLQSLYQQALRESPKKWNLLLDSYLLREGELSDGDDLDRSFSNDVKQVTARFQQYRNPDVVSISSLAQAIQGTSKSEYIKRNVDP
ncbi:uncharacterized protein Gasu_44830 [Galdieria sulphuraria]|uniref:Uncharacterized protein n=1 Tax=Galdieria sulphuraria TaxID=130081 RepID=M2XX32_GALSU|nr:uncharacterized protein Gasu_44830 [Galdieria sulphuraria]EME27979.1 hypothetical protein Gasu_44830 [Galdieria sulphuraria]|eukprot:XP_005704499.1 hypothetical protein Gasu_44830 [Galdieria sulphuraria]